MTDLLIRSNPLAWRIRARFAGGLPPREYITPDIRRHSPGWGDKVFNRQIESLELCLPTGHRIVLSGMEQYNFFVEASQPLSGGANASIEAFWLCGKIPASAAVEAWRVGNGRVYRSRVPWGREWGGGPTSGWRPGAIGGAVISKICAPSSEG